MVLLMLVLKIDYKQYFLGKQIHLINHYTIDINKSSGECDTSNF